MASLSAPFHITSQHIHRFADHPPEEVAHAAGDAHDGLVGRRAQVDPPVVQARVLADGWEAPLRWRCARCRGCCLFLGLLFVRGIGPETLSLSWVGWVEYMLGQAQRWQYALRAGTHAVP